MHFHCRNVNDAFQRLVKGFAAGRFNEPGGTVSVVRGPSRVGEVLAIPEPVTVTFDRPKERVLFNQARDANPFLHLYESLWMLAGRRDIDPVAYYAENYRKQVQDGDSPEANGAYGYRWRHASAGVAEDWGRVHPRVEVDQLPIIVEHLKRKPESRRVVLSMWNVEDDLLKIDSSKDVCCNTAAYFSIRKESSPALTEWRREAGHVLNEHKYLDMTVTNRSNDLVWGMLGANVVHFSFLQEYLAACIGVEVGVYHQFSNNLHVYTERFEPEKWLSDTTPVEGRYVQIPLVKDRQTFDLECIRFVDQAWGGHEISLWWEEPFLQDVAMPMAMAFYHHKQRVYEKALQWMSQVGADDWRIAGTNWINKRQANYERKKADATITTDGSGVGTDAD